MDSKRSLKDMQAHALAILDFLSSSQHLVDNHLMTFFSDENWKLCDESWLSVMRNMEISGICDIVMGHIDPSFPNEMKRYLQTAMELRLSGLFCPRNTTSRKRKARHHLLGQGLSNQKEMEIEGMACIVANAAKAVNAGTIVDLGAGSGHLATTLAYELGLNVVAVDGSAHQIKTLRSRNDAYLEYEKKKGNNIESRLHVMHYAFEDDGKNLLEMLKSISSEGLVICGLHTCGDLSPSSLRLVEIDTEKIISGIVNIGCCYNLMTCDGIDMSDPRVTAFVQDSESMENGKCGLGWGDEKWSNLKVGKEEEEERDKWTLTTESGSSYIAPRRPLNIGNSRPTNPNGYPMSLFIQTSSIPFMMGSKARNLALESSSRWVPENFSVDNPSFLKNYWRSCLQVFLNRKVGRKAAQRIVVGRIGKKLITSFSHYVMTSLAQAQPKSIVSTFTVERCDLVEIEAQCREKLKDFISFWALRAVLGPCIESLILLDRAIYLNERGMDVDITPTFDSNLSPRNNSIIGLIRKSE